MAQPSPAAYARQIVKALEAVHEPGFAEGQQNFFQESVRTIGARGDDVKSIANDAARAWKTWTMAERIACCEALWRDGRLECGGVACHALRKYERAFTAAEFDVFESWLERYVTNWAHCDGVSTWLVAGVLNTQLRAKSKASKLGTARLDDALDKVLARDGAASGATRNALFKRVQRWTKHESRWMRRAAAVSLVPAARHGADIAWILDIAERLKRDEDDMVRKGLGWLLKDAWPAQPDTILEFVKTNRDTLAKLVVRIAKEKMDADARAELR